MTTAAILNLLFLSILVTRSTSGSSRQHYCKISLIYVNRRLSYCYNCAKMKDGGRHLGFYFCSIFWHACMCDLKSNTYAKLCAIINEMWAINEIQNGGRRHLEFIIFVNFGQMLYFRWQPSTLLQNFIHLRQSAVELLLFVQKSKMAVAAILGFIFV